MSTLAKARPPKSAEGFGAGVLAFLAVLVADFLALGLANMVGNQIVGLNAPDYDIRQPFINHNLLLLYVAAVEGLGLYWWFYRNRTARLIGMCLGLVPILFLVYAFVNSRYC